MQGPTTMLIGWPTLILFYMAIFTCHSMATQTQFEIAALLANGEKSPCTIVLFGLDYKWISVSAAWNTLCNHKFIKYLKTKKQW